MIRREPRDTKSAWRWVWCWRRHIGDYVFICEWVRTLYTDKGDRNYTVTWASDKLQPPEFHTEFGQHEPEW